MPESKAVFIISLNGSNYLIWRIQCQMALMKDGICGKLLMSPRRHLQKLIMQKDTLKFIVLGTRQSGRCESMDELVSCIIILSADVVHIHFMYFTSYLLV